MWLLAVAVLVCGPSCSFHPILGNKNYWPCQPDGTCNRGCSCIDGQVCVPDEDSPDADCSWCPEGSGDCNGDVSDGCEVEFRTDPHNWCSCGHWCQESDLCQRGLCVQECGQGLSPCDGWCLNLNIDPENCGECDKQCASGKVCTGGECASECDGTLVDCEGTCADLDSNPDHCGECDNSCDMWSACCEGSCRSVKSDESNCGGCDAVCPIDQVCDHMVCHPCEYPKMFCDGDCHDVMTCSDHCGNCETSCGEGQTCENGECVAENCTDPLENCSGQCVNLMEDPEHCGICGHTCAAGQICLDGNCVFDECPPGEKLCGDGCVDTLNSPDHCGDCFVVCNNPPDSKCDTTGQYKIVYSGPGDCQNGICLYDFNEVYCPNGCQNGACVSDPCNGVTCAPYEVCVAGDCVCSASGTVCLGETICCASGCTDPWADNQNCGQCGIRCENFAYCLANSCVCDADGTICDDSQACCSNGCTDLSSDPLNCGECGNTCGESATCHMGSCRCNQDFGNCDDTWETGCEEYLPGSFLNCGECGNSCDMGLPPAECDEFNNVVTYRDTFCSDGQCEFYTETTECPGEEVCANGTCYCNPSSGLICEGAETCCEIQCVNTQNDPWNCGGCYQACLAGITCIEGHCGKAGVECSAGTICNAVNPDDICCAPGSNDAYCTATAQCPSGVVGCDGPEDCPAETEVCCHSPMFPDGHLTQCLDREMCQQDFQGTVLCNGNWQCKALDPSFACCPLPIPGISLHICSNLCSGK